MMISFLRADVLETGQFHRVFASNCDGLRDTTLGFVRSFGPTFLIGKEGYKYRKFCKFLSLMGVFQ